MHDNDFDINKLRIDIPDISTSAGVLGSNLRRRRHRDQFVRVPVMWMDRLNSARLTATWKIALHLLFQCFKDRRQTIKLANGVMALKGVTRRQKWRALKELEELGLVSIEHRPRKSPEITLLYPTEGR